MTEMKVSTAFGTVQNLTTVDTTGPGNAVRVGGARTYTLQAIVTGTPTAYTVTLEGSLDGTNWFVLASVTEAGDPFVHAVDKPVEYVRANLTTLTGGTSPTVTALICAKY